MRKIQYTKLATILQSLSKKTKAYDQHLKPLIVQAKKIEVANKRLKRFLPPPLSEHVTVCNIKDNTLILQTNSPAWSTRTNFIAAEIVNYMRNEGGLAMVERLKVKVIPSQTRPSLPSQSIEPISTATSELLNSVASGINDKNLSDILKRLSEHNKK